MIHNFMYGCTVFFKTNSFEPYLFFTNYCFLPFSNQTIQTILLIFILSTGKCLILYEHKILFNIMTLTTLIITIRLFFIKIYELLF